MVLIVNPTAGRRGVTAVLRDAVANLEKRDLRYEIRTTSGPGHATELARAALESGHKLVVAVGGDGTIHEVVNGMMADDRSLVEGATLGVVPAGTSSDFIRTFGLPSTPVHAVAHLDGPGSFPIDLGKVTYRSGGEQASRYFANIAEAGLGAEVTARTRRLPSWLGPMAYLLASWSVLATGHPVRVTIDLIDRAYEGPMLNLVVANGQFYGGGMKVAPRAAPTDGVLDIQIQNVTKLEAVALLPKIYSGGHVPHQNIKESKRVKVSITSDRPVPVEADGELLGFTPATFEVLPNVISLKV
ncbi:MAG: diacylglycerol kinase family lipid kinase [Actinobacteria bacterium]|nr:diacylglycerol kinase family lipid kinase [Actinomycetota bacterium]